MKNNSLDINSKPNWFFLAVIVLAFPLVYFHLFFAGFIAWDDPEYVLNNRDVHAFSVKLLFTKYYVGNYHPITMLNYALDWKLFGKWAVGYHIESIVWHLLNTVLVFFLGKKLKLKSLQSFLLAIVFAFHPLQLESMAWVAERKNVLYAFFFLGSLLYYFEYKEKQNSKYLIYVYVGFILSLLSKPAAVVLPLVLMLIDQFIYKENFKQYYKRYILFLLLSVALGVVTVFAQEEAKFLLNTHNYPVISKIGIFGYGLFHYVSKFLVPVNLSAFYSYPDNLTSITAIGFITLLVFVGLLYILIQKKQYHVLFGMLFFLINLILVLQVMPFGDAITADRYMYLPIIGLTFCLIILLNKLSLNRIFVLSVTAILALSSCIRSILWEESLPLFLNVLKSNPTSFIANNSLGVEYMEKNDFGKAYQFLNQTIKLYPTYYKGYYNRGLLNGKTQNYDNAISDFTKAIEFRNYYKAYVGRANVYYILKDYPKAITDAEEVLKTDANNVKANVVLANCYDDLNQLDKAMGYYNKALSINQDDPSVYLRRGILYGKKMNFISCLQDLEECTSINPKFAEAYYWKGVVKVNMKLDPCSDLRKAVELGFLAAQQPLANYCR